MCDLKPSMVSPYAPCPSAHCYSPADIPQNFAWHPPSFHPSTCSQNTTSAHQSPALYCPFLSLWLAIMAAAHKPAPQSYPFCLHFLRLSHRTSSRTDTCSTLDLSAPRRQKGFSELSAIFASCQRRQNRQPYLLQTIWLHHLFPARPESLHTPAYMGVPDPIKQPLRLYTARHTSPHQIKGQHCQFLFISMHEYAGPDPYAFLSRP